MRTLSFLLILSILVSACKKDSNKKVHFAEGTITFSDPVDFIQKPLANLSVLIKNGSQIHETITDSHGRFHLEAEFQNELTEVFLKFDNAHLEIRKLDLGRLDSLLDINVISVGRFHKNMLSNISISIGPNTESIDLYHSAAVFFSYQQFRTFALAHDYTVPQKKLTIWIGKDLDFGGGYAAPMLNYIGIELAQTRKILTNLLGVEESLAVWFADQVQDKLPDIYVPYYSSDLKRNASHIETLFHEFGHSVHFMRAGEGFWLDYINHIVEYGGYGSGSEPLSGLVAMSEAWAEDFSMELLFQVYGSSLYSQSNRDAHSFYNYTWIPAGIYYDLTDDDDQEAFDQVTGFTFPKLYRTFSPEIRSPQQFRDRLFDLYPEKSDAQRKEILALFEHYGYG